MATPSAALTDAQRALLNQLDERESAARLAWTAAQRRTAVAIAEEQAALADLDAASSAATTLKSALSQISASLNPSFTKAAVETKAARLTADILAEIFKFTAESYEFVEEVPSMPLPACPAFRAASVSRHWRNVAVATPSLWAKAYLRFTLATCEDLKARLDTILARTRNVPLDLVLLETPSAERFELLSREDEEALISAFARARRIRMTCDHPSVSFKDSLLPLLQVTMPCLTSFSIVVGFDEYIPEFKDVPTNVRLLSLCPNLRELDIARLSFSHIDPASMPLMERFTTRNELFDEHTALAICRAWPKLKSLDVSLVLHVAPSIATPADRLSNLATLNCHTRGSHILRVFSPLHLPALQELSMDYKTSREHRNLTSFLASGPCTSLRKLNLRGMDVPSFLGSVLSLPNLSELCLFDLPHAFVHALFATWCADDTVRHPLQLQTLQLTNCHFAGNASHAVLEFIEERKRAQADDVTAISELIIEQYETYKTREDVFEPWMTARVQQLVERVKINTASAYVTD